MATRTTPAAPTTKTTPGTPTTSPAAPVGSPARARRRPALIGIGVALTAAGALGASYLVTSTSETVPVVVVTSAVVAGDQLTVDDLGTASISLDPTVQTVPGDQITDLVGQYATVELLPGSLLTSAAVAPEPTTPAQASTVGVVLTPAQMPSEPLAPGRQVLLVETPAAGETLEGAPLSTQAQVLSTSTVIDTNQTVVNVALEAGPAAPLAARAAAGRLALVLLPADTAPGQGAAEDVAADQPATADDETATDEGAAEETEQGSTAPAAEAQTPTAPEAALEAAAPATPQGQG
ncbi:SAF domain-containing protein [uncultured Pseudokineococcus sp.]|uniref:SAF domain-containing protein n=1 Tax=uncultured Pseudokineococcus sp. TaxID=1642928 RepID=UPI002619E821|nr:SAF domain-containing protein [uncultured Pseudokineococcus sp.]